MGSNLFNEDFQDFIKALNLAKVRYMLVGGYSVVLHGYQRTTGDMDIWVERTPVNYALLVHAFSLFGMPLFDMSEHNFLHNQAINVFTFGRQPAAIDLMLSVKGLRFEDAYANARPIEVDGIQINLIQYRDLITAKTASARPRDLDDIENLRLHKGE